MGSVERALNGYNGVVGHGAVVSAVTVALLLMWNAMSDKVDNVERAVEVNRLSNVYMQRDLTDLRATGVRSSDMDRIESRLTNLESKLDNRLKSIEQKVDALSSKRDWSS